MTISDARLANAVNVWAEYARAFQPEDLVRRVLEIDDAFRAANHFVDANNMVEPKLPPHIRLNTYSDDIDRCYDVETGGVDGTDGSKYYSVLDLRHCTNADLQRIVDHDAWALRQKASKPAPVEVSEHEYPQELRDRIYKILNQHLSERESGAIGHAIETALAAMNKSKETT